MANFLPRTELDNVRTDADIAHRDPFDQEKAHRLNSEVMNYMHRFNSSQDTSNLTKALMGAGYTPVEVAQLEQRYLPPLQITNENQVRNKQYTTTESPLPAPAEAAQQPKSLDDIVHEVHSTEDRYHMTEYASTKTQEDLKQSLKDVQKFCADNPSQAKELISKLEAQDLIGQLSIAAIEQTPAGQSGRSLSKDETLSLFNGTDPFNKSIHDHLQSAFSIPQPSDKQFGIGYANGIRPQNGNERLSYATTPDDIPVITKQHLDELMQRFDHGPAYHREGQ